MIFSFCISPVLNYAMFYGQYDALKLDRQSVAIRRVIFSNVFIQLLLAKRPLILMVVIGKMGELLPTVK